VAPIWVNDPGDSGVADRWTDLAIAERSLRYNYRGDWRGESFDGYGVAPDQGRMDDYLRVREDGD
jgi:kanamycin kinase